MNAREKAAKAAIAAKRYNNDDGTTTAFHVTKKGARDVDTATDGGHKEGIIRSIGGTIGGLKRKTR